MPDPIAKFRVSSAKRIVKASRWVELQPKSAEGASVGANIASDGFWAKITASLAVSGHPNRWQYAWTEQRPTVAGWADHPRARTGTTTSRFALNSVEANNPDAAGMMGNSVDTAATTTTMAPVRGNPVVWMREVSAWNSLTGAYVQGFRFQYENTVECGS